ncbi:hypothetical protein MY4038_004418 [Beauveria bassiana]
MLPSSWKLPFGIDKLLKSLEAEKKQRLPLFSLEDHQKYGDTYAQYAGGLFTIITRDSRNISSVLSEQFAKFGHGQLRSICFGPLLGQSIFTEDGAAWKASRRLLASELHKPHYPALHIFESHFQDLLRSLMEKQSQSSSTLNVRDALHDYALDTATELFLDNSTNILSLPSEANNEGTRFSEAFNTAMQWLATRERFKMFAWLVTTPAMLKTFATARDSLENMISESQQAEASDLSKSAFADFLGKSTGMSKARDELMSLLVAGRDSNASLLCWLVYALAREHEVLEKLRAEVTSILGNDSDSLPDDAHLAKMRYLDDVVNETLRLFPAVPLNGRLCSTSTTLPAGGGESGEEPIYVPKGTLICLSTFACQRSTTYYGSDAHEFRPERWQQVDAKVRTSDFTFHPFIGGPRKCLGERFAIKLAKYTICRLVQSCSIITVGKDELAAGSNWQENTRYHNGLTMAPGDGVFVQLDLR